MNGLLVVYVLHKYSKCSVLQLQYCKILKSKQDEDKSCIGQYLKIKK